MPDSRQHRGAHQSDPRLFGPEFAAVLRRAGGDLSWLLTRGYAVPSSLKLVGDRYNLTARQRLAVARCSCSDQAMHRRQQRCVAPQDLARQELWIDGYNVLTSVEAALAGGVILKARDSSYRDMASMHGSYRRVAETVPAIGLIGDVLAGWNVSSCRWVLDRPVSNSGRLRTLLAEQARRHGWVWEIMLVDDADPVLIESGHVAASADSQILDRVTRWCNLARSVIDTLVPDAWIVNLSD